MISIAERIGLKFSRYNHGYQSELLKSAKGPSWKWNWVRNGLGLEMGLLWKWIWVENGFG